MKINFNLDFFKKLAITEGINFECYKELHEVFKTEKLQKDIKNYNSFLFQANPYLDYMVSSQLNLDLNLSLNLNEFKEKIKIPTQWKISEMYNNLIIYQLLGQNI